ncbi:MAG: hypothetical protein AB8F94_30055, partial [Saprospiraceae bacterium]
IENKKGGGKSSTMPHKNNPVLSEAIVALSKYVFQLSANNLHAIIHTQERDGSALALEWISLPQMMVSIGGILNHSLIISKNIKVNKKVMEANLNKLNGLVFSEQATFVLCKYLTKKEAKEKLGMACQIVLSENIHLAEVLEGIFPTLEIDWKEILQAKNYQGSTSEILQNK